MLRDTNIRSVSDDFVARGRHELSVVRREIEEHHTWREITVRDRPVQRQTELETGIYRNTERANDVIETKTNRRRDTDTDGRADRQKQTKTDWEGMRHMQ